MNPLEKWRKEFEKKRDEIVKKYNLQTPEEIAEFFMYENISKKEPDFCPLFKEGKVCHDINKKRLNCYFCACPYFDDTYWNDKLKEYGFCSIFSVFGKRNEHGYLDCSRCTVPHSKDFVIRKLKKEG